MRRKTTSPDFGRCTVLPSISTAARWVEVMAAITEGLVDVALVFDKDDLLGIFTESDYIRVSNAVWCSNKMSSLNTSYSLPIIS